MKIKTKRNNDSKNTMEKRTIKFYTSFMCNPKVFNELQFDKYGVRVLKISFNPKTRITTFKIISTLSGRKALATAIRRKDNGWRYGILHSLYEGEEFVS